MPSSYAKWIWLFSVILWKFGFSKGMYLPGVVPRDYTLSEQVDLKVNKLTSSKAQLSYDYYKLPFCQPEKIKPSANNIQELLTGSVIQNSPYEINFLITEQCKVLYKKNYSIHEATTFVNKLKDNYLVTWILDNLPSTFPLGGTLVDSESNEVMEHFLNNHHTIIIKYHFHDEGLVQEDRFHDKFLKELNGSAYGARIVGFDVEPFSVRHQYEGKWDDAKPPALSTCNEDNPVRREMRKDYVMSLDGNSSEEISSGNGATRKKKINETLEVVWTYDIKWEYSTRKWADRWDVYMNSNGKQEDKVNWFAVVNSLLIVVFLTGMVDLIFFG